MRTLKFGEITFSSEGDTPYLFSFFNPNEGTTKRQEDIPVNYDGCLISNINYEPRVVNIQGHIIAETYEDFVEVKQGLYNECNGVTADYLYWYDGTNTYRAYAIAEFPSLGEMKGSSCCQFNVNFTLPGFFWESNAEKTMVKATQYTFAEQNGTLRSFREEFTNNCNSSAKSYLVARFINNSGSDITCSFEVLSGEAEKKGMAKTEAITVAAGKTLIIDCANNTIMLDGSDITNQFTEYTQPYITSKSSSPSLRVYPTTLVTSNPMSTSLSYRERYAGV